MRIPHRAKNDPGRGGAAYYKRTLLWAMAGLVFVLLGVATYTEAWFGEPTTPAMPPASPLAPTVDAVPLSVDVVIYGTQTSGLTAAYEILREDPRLRVAIISSGEYLETPLAQGLSVEDARDVFSVAGGAYEEWRDSVIAYYLDRGTSPFTTTGRFVYEPAVAVGHLWALLHRPGVDPITFCAGRLVGASDSDGTPSLEVRLASGSLVTIEADYLIDASVEADLARMLGASYRIGRDETAYNDLAGLKPAAPSPANGYLTAPQRFSVLLTLRVHADGSAPLLSESVAPLHSSTTVPLRAATTLGFGHSWSMVVARLPNDSRELNESWSDYPDVAAAFQWMFEPARRAAIMQSALKRALGQVSYLQQNGYPELGVACVPSYPYVREGPRIVGLTTYTVGDLLTERETDVVATGCYAEYDRHDAFAPTQIDATATIHVPMHALLVEGHPRLVVCTAISTDYRAYCSAVRTELGRANMGGAAGVIVVLAARAGADTIQVPYDQVRNLLEQRGYELGGS
jgi:hypothetical protein